MQVFKHAMDNYPSFALLESNVNQLYTFYKVSGKRLGDLMSVAQDCDGTYYAMTKIYEVRWVTRYLDFTYHKKQCINNIMGN